MFQLRNSSIQFSFVWRNMLKYLNYFLDDLRQLVNSKTILRKKLVGLHLQSRFYWKQFSKSFSCRQSGSMKESIWTALKVVLDDVLRNLFALYIFNERDCKLPSDAENKNVDATTFNLCVTSRSWKHDLNVRFGLFTITYCVFE